MLLFDLHVLSFTIASDEYDRYCEGEKKCFNLIFFRFLF